MIVATLTREISSVPADFGVFGGDGGARPAVATVERMANVSENDPIDDVAPGDVVLVARNDSEPAPYQVVHKDARDGAVVVTYQTDDGTTFEVEYPAGARVTRSLEAKWESEQSPTQHKPD